LGLLQVQLLGAIGARALRASRFLLLPSPPCWLMTDEALDHIGRESLYGGLHSGGRGVSDDGSDALSTKCVALRGREPGAGRM